MKNDKKNQNDAKSTDELLKKLQASVIADQENEQKTKADADEKAFQSKIEGMLRNVTGEEPKKPEKVEKPKKSEKKPKSDEGKPPVTEKAVAKPAEKTAEKPIEQPTEKTAEKPIEKTPEKTSHVPDVLRIVTEGNPNETNPTLDTKTPEKEEKFEQKVEQKVEPKDIPTPPTEKQETAVQEQKKTQVIPQKPKTETKPLEQKPTESKPVEQKPIVPKAEPKKAEPNVTRPSEKKVEKPVEKPIEKATEKPVAQPAVKIEQKPIVIGGEKGTTSANPIVIKPRKTARMTTPTTPVKKAEPKQTPIVIKPPKPAEQPTEKTVAKPTEKPVEKTIEKPAEKPIEKKGSTGMSIPKTRISVRPWEKPQTAETVQKPAQTPQATQATPTAQTTPTAPNPTQGSAKPTQKATPQLIKKPVQKKPVQAVPLPEENHLRESLEDTASDATSTQVQEPEPQKNETPVNQKPTANPKARRKAVETIVTVDDPLTYTEQKTGLDEDDIALMFELGYDNELGHLVGVGNMKKMRREYAKKYEGKEHRRNRASFGFRGVDSTEGEDGRTAQTAYRHDRTWNIWRMILTGLCMLLLALLDIEGLNATVDSYRTSYGWLFSAVSLLLLLASASLSHRQIDSGLRNLWRFSPTPYSVIAVLTPIAILYSIAVLVLADKMTLQPIGLGMATAYFLTTVCDQIRIANEMRTLNLILSDGKKYALDVAEPRKKKLRMSRGGKIVRIVNDEIGENLYRVRECERLDGFFGRCNDFSGSAKPFTVLLILMFALSILCGFFGAVKTDDFAVGLSAFATALCFTVPTSAVYLWFYSLGRANKTLAKSGSALVGDGSVGEYSQKKTVIFDDNELYTEQKCTQILARNNENCKEDLRIAGIVFRKLSKTYDAVGMKMSQDPNDTQIPVNILRTTEKGVEARVDNRHGVIIGTAEFLKENNISVPQMPEPQGNVSVMYVVIDGRLRLSYEIAYTASSDFDSMVRMLAKTDTVAIETYDPNLNQAFLTRSRGENAPFIRVYNSGKYESDIADAVIDSGVITKGKETDIVRPVAIAGKVKQRRHALFIMLIVTAVLGAGACGFLTVMPNLLSAGAKILLPIVYRFFWDIVITVASFGYGFRK